MEQLFGARIGARIKQLFGARIRDPKGTAFRGPNRGPNRTTFRGPGLLAVDVSLGNLHICVHQPSFRGSNGIRLFGPESGTRMEQLFGARIGARIEQLFGARGSWLCMFLQGLFGCPLFQSAHLYPPAIFSEPEWYTTFRGPNPGPEWNSFSGPNRGPNRTTFRGPGLLAVDVSPGALCNHRFFPTFRGPNPGPEWNSFSGPERGPNRTTFRGPGLLAVDVPPGALWRPPFQSAHLCPPAIFLGPEWNDFLGPEPSARMVVFFLWCLNTLCKLDFFVFWGSKA